MPFLIRLEGVLSSADDSEPPLSTEDDCLLSLALAQVYDELNIHEQANQLYHRACPYLIRPLAAEEDVDRFQMFLLGSPLECHVTAMLEYFDFAIRTFRDLALVEHMLRTLPWTSSPSIDKPVIRRNSFYITRVLNAQHMHEEASRHDRIHTSFWKPDAYTEDGAHRHEQGIFLAALGSRAEARWVFIKALTISSIVKGLWHRQTLNIMLYLGNALKEWHEQAAALRVLEECCRGLFYRFGRTHPISVRAWSEFSRCEGSRQRRQDLLRFGHPETCPKRRLSLAYEHINVHTIIEILRYVPEMDYSRLHGALKTLSPYISPGRQAVDFRRTEWSCRTQVEPGQLLRVVPTRFSLTDRRESSSPSDFMCDRLQEVAFEIRRGIAASHTAGIHAISLLFEWNKLRTDEQMDWLRAIHRQLTAMELTHFTQGVLIKSILEETLETLGTGAHAIVDAVRIGKSNYARKSVALPRYRQQQTRQAIEQEISVIRALDHPHIVEIHLTYEDKDRFYIVMEPLADCDLEAFLAIHTPTPITSAQTKMIRKWYLCLANTLAYIHSKGIRHKDIKPRNILIKGEEIIFADFGSSHIFIDEGNSTIEGPSHGHTKMYCAPEVIAQGKRNRSADVFSLGCAFTELAVWYAGRDIVEWHKYRETVVDGVTTSCYHATVDKVEPWFRSLESTSAILYIADKVLCPMLHTDPTQRLTATQVSQAFTSIFRYIKPLPQTVVCMDCRIDMWVDLDDHVIDRSGAKHNPSIRHQAASKEDISPTFSPKVSSFSAPIILKVDSVEKPRETHVHDGRVPPGLEGSKTERKKKPAPGPFFKWAIGPNIAKKK